MVVGLPVALAMLAQAAEAAPGPATQTQALAATSSTAPANSCPPPAPNSSTIVICAERSDGYRLNPDVMEAKRETRSAGRPVRPGGGTPRPDCATVGPQRCVNAGVNLLAAALTAAEMAKRLASGQEVGSMFLTDPQPDEYHLYLMAKARREAAEAQKAADAKAKATAPAPASPQAPAQTDGN
jgi:hypothetical protein